MKSNLYWLSFESQLYKNLSYITKKEKESANYKSINRDRVWVEAEESNGLNGVLKK